MSKPWPPEADAFDAFLKDFQRRTGTEPTGVYVGFDVYKAHEVHEMLWQPGFVKPSRLSNGRVVVTDGVSRFAYGPLA